MDIYLSRKNINYIRDNLCHNFKLDSFFFLTISKKYLLEYTNITYDPINIITEYLIEINKTMLSSYCLCQKRKINSIYFYVRTINYYISIHSDFDNNNSYLTKNKITIHDPRPGIFKLVLLSCDGLKDTKCISDKIEKIHKKKDVIFDKTSDIPVPLLNSFLSINDRIDYKYDNFVSYMRIHSKYFSRCYILLFKYNSRFLKSAQYLLIIEDEIEFEKIVHIIKFFTKLLHNMVKEYQ